MLRYDTRKTMMTWGEHAGEPIEKLTSRFLVKAANDVECTPSMRDAINGTLSARKTGVAVVSMEEQARVRVDDIDRSARMPVKMPVFRTAAKVATDEAKRIRKQVAEVQRLADQLRAKEARAKEKAAKRMANKEKHRVEQAARRQAEHEARIAKQKAESSKAPLDTIYCAAARARYAARGWPFIDPSACGQSSSGPEAVLAPDLSQ